MSDQPQQKPMMSTLKLGELNKLYKETMAMPEGPEKASRLADLKEFHEFMLNKYDLPVEPLRPDMAALKAGATVLGYGSGIKDTILGEGAKLIGKPAEALFGHGDGYTVQDAKDAGSAMLGALTAGYAGKQKSLADYRHDLGIGDGPSLADTEWGKSHGLDRNKWYMPTVGGVADFALGALTDPALVSRAMKANAAKKLTDELAKMPYKDAAARLTEELAKKNAPLMSAQGVKNAAAKAGHAIADPLGAAGEAAIRFRFRDASKATKAAGKQDFVDTWLQGNREGFTSEGIRQGIDKDIAAKEGLIDQIENPKLLTPGEAHEKYPGFPNPPGQQNAMPVRSQSELLAHLRNPDGGIPDALQQKISRPGVTDAYTGAREEILNEFRNAAKRTPGLGDIYERDQALAGRAAHGGPDNGILRETPPQVSTVERTTQPHTVNTLEGFQEGQSVYPGAKSEVQVGQPIPPGADVSHEGYTIGGQPKMRVTVPQDRVVPERTPIWKQETTPGQKVGTTRMDSAPIAHELPAPDDILDPSRYERYFTPKELRQTARDYQQKARSSAFYSQPTKWDPKTKQNLKAIEENMALGKLQHDTGMRARQLEMEALDDLNTGLGGKVHSQYKDISSMLEGAPYLDRPFMGPKGDYGVSLGRRLFYKNPVLGFATDALTGTGNVLSMAGGKAALSPLGLAAQNAARQKLPEYYDFLKSNNAWSNAQRFYDQIQQEKKDKEKK
jgi:hypothetical protein